MIRLPVTIRAAGADDEAGIVALVRSERLNPFDLDWRRFMLATDSGGIIGAVQLREHDDGSRELGSLVVRRNARRHGIGARLIDAVLTFQNTRVFMITGAAFARHYVRWCRRRGPSCATTGSDASRACRRCWPAASPIVSRCCSANA
jgi:GNAT superfamily N-acetyltransferase